MLKLSERYPDPKEHVEAAKLFHLPYWDYYRPRAWDAEFTGIMLDSGNMTKAPVDFRMPLIFTQAKVMITTPDTGGEPQLMDNPLLFYNFPEGGIHPDDWDILMLDVPLPALTLKLLLTSVPGSFEDTYQALRRQ